ncbi:RDD family protein [Lonepinella sp. BR2271]|uniref:RDD family protein n=1 Tax=Lonepinella sp. BR2271 TaxID=3434550 RepID=UPI003F6E1C67
MLVENPNTVAPVIKTDEVMPVIYAGRGWRWLASIINFLIFIAFLLVGGFIAGFVGDDITVIPLLAIVVYSGLQIWAMKTYQQTLGKKWLGLKVVSYTTFEPISLGRYIAREVVEGIGGQLVALGLFDAICAFIRKDRRSVTDLMFSTIVISVPNDEYC